MFPDDQEIICPDYFYSVGGRIKFGETAEEAVVREVLEETGVQMEIDHLGFVQENYYIGDYPGKIGKEIYELRVYFYMKVPEDFEPVREHLRDGQTEFLEWVSPDEPMTIYPDFSGTELDIAKCSVKHMVKDDRIYTAFERKHYEDGNRLIYPLAGNTDAEYFLLKT